VARTVSLRQAKDVSVIAAAILVPIAVAVLGGALANAGHREELAVKYVELSLKLLNAEPKDSPGDKALRGWAVNLLDAYSPPQARLSDAAKRALLSSRLQTLSIRDTGLQLLHDGLYNALQGYRNGAIDSKKFSEAVERVLQGAESIELTNDSKTNNGVSQP